jgi:hypothetical protein
MRRVLFFVFSILLIGVTMLGFSFKGKASDNKVSDDDCYVTWSEKPIRDNNTQQYYIVIDNGCPFAVQVTCRNGGIDYGKYLGSGEKGQKLVITPIGGKVEQDYKVTAARAPGS